MNVIAFYLPQFHQIPENDEWWGEGFTEWTNVKNAKPLFPDQYQPRIPLNKNYYNLLEDHVKEWQIQLAKKYGVSGFCFYHYWFDGKLLLEKPVEQYLANKKLDLPFCICWANEDWTNVWKSEGDSKTLIAQTYGGKKQWEAHFEYLWQYFKDDRYIKIEGKPLIVIYRPEIIPCIKEMILCWRELAANKGLPGLTLAYQTKAYYEVTNGKDEAFDFRIEYQPNYAFLDQAVKDHRVIYPVYNWVRNKLVQIVKEDVLLKKKPRLKVYSYDKIWENVLHRKPIDKKSIPGAFVDWDNTSRKGEKGSILSGASPEKFQKYMTEQIRRTKEIYKKDMLFLFAWNEWAEGGYMEPDERYKYGYLQALYDALKANEAILTK